jgi:8-oxo-dGTP pyrophosphatase MutT (NUDIX family)
VDLEPLRRNLEQRIKKSLEAAPPLLRAGVLIPLIPSPEGTDLLLTRRTETVLTHKGQISFPGGQAEEGDQAMVQTALRETYEEIGLDPSRVEVIGELDDVFTAVSGFVITPFVGVVSGGVADLRPAPHEVKDLLVVPVDRLMDPAVHTTETRTAEGYQYKIHFYTVGGDVIWGATGRIVYQLLKVWQTPMN